MSRFAVGAARLESRRQQYVAVAASYSRVRPSNGGDSSLTLPPGITISAPDNGNVTVSATINVTVTRPKAPTNSADGFTLTTNAWDFLVLITDLSAFWTIANIGTTNPAEPMQGDLISAVDQQQNAETYTVAMESGTKFFEPSFTVYGNSWRIHTKRVG